jgi:hypothetical protein
MSPLALLLLILSIINVHAIDVSSSVPTNFLERAFAEIKDVVSEFSNQANSSASLFTAKYLAELARSPLASTVASESGSSSSETVQSKLQDWVNENNEWLQSSLLLRDLDTSLKGIAQICRPAAFAAPKLIPTTTKFPSFSIVLKGASCEFLDNGETVCEPAKFERYQSPTRVIPEHYSRAEYRGPTCNTQACLNIGLYPGQLSESEFQDGELLDDFLAVANARCGNPVQRILGKKTFSFLSLN